MSDDSSEQIARHLRSLTATASPGSKLPSTRDLAARFGAGPVTVQRALAMVVADGLVETRPGRGTFVRARPTQRRGAEVAWQTAALGPRRDGASPVGSTLRQVSHDTIAMHSGYPDESLLPIREVSAALGRVARRSECYRRPPIAGIPELRRWFADELSATDSPGSAPAESWHSADVMVASGGQAALAAAFRALAAPGEPIVMESPTYWGAIGAARQAGLVIVPVPRSDGAPRADDLDAALTSSGARVFYAQPNHANPTGDRWDAGQRSAILDVITAHRAFLVEDDWAHDLGIDEPVRPLAVADRDGHVVYVRSLTKSMSPSMRVAGILARGPARVRIEQALAHSDLFVSPILQWAALEVVSRPAWRTHRKTLARALGDRRDALLAALREAGFDPRRPAGGLHLWVDLGVGRAGDAPPDADAVVGRALTKGLAISPGTEWFPAEPTGLFVRLTYSAVTPDRYDDAVRILSESL